MLSICIQFVPYMYTEHTLTNCMHMLSISLWIICKCSAYAYEKHIKPIDLIWIMRICWVYTYELYANAEYSCSYCMRTLSVNVQFVRVCSAYAYDTLNKLSIGVGNFRTETLKKVLRTLFFKKTFLRLYNIPKINYENLFFFQS